MREIKNVKTAQTLSTDAIVAVVLFFLAALMLFYLSGSEAGTRWSDKLQRDSDKLPSALSSEQNISSVFIEGTKVNEGKLGRTLDTSYETLKDQLGIDSDFCIYFEDEKGNIVPMRGKVGIGSPLANISGNSCNATITSG